MKSSYALLVSRPTCEKPQSAVECVGNFVAEWMVEEKSGVLVRYDDV